MYLVNKDYYYKKQSIFTIFGAMAKDSYLEISSHFGIYPLEQSIALRGDKFLKKYSSSDNYLCRLIAKH